MGPKSDMTRVFGEKATRGHREMVSIHEPRREAAGEAEPTGALLPVSRLQSREGSMSAAQAPAQGTAFYYGGRRRLTQSPPTPSRALSSS